MMRGGREMSAPALPGVGNWDVYRMAEVVVDGRPGGYCNNVR